MDRTISGIYLPIITPFENDVVDEVSYRNLINHYMTEGISGIIPLGTTGESPCITESEYERIIAVTMEETQQRVPVYIGVGGSFTRAVLDKLRMIESYAIDGILSVCPYYNRPSQFGLYEHFLKISETTPLPIIIYNIPYRTGVNLENDTLFRLAELENIVGVKDACGNIKQTLNLLQNKPNGFSVLSGDDHLFYTMMANGGDGGILSSAHVCGPVFLEIFTLMQKNDYPQALERWQSIKEIISLLFSEPSPAPVKYCLQQMGLIRSHEVRLPLVESRVRKMRFFSTSFNCRGANSSEYEPSGVVSGLLSVEIMSSQKRSSGHMQTPSHSSTARSMIFSSSRTFPLKGRDMIL